MPIVCCCFEPHYSYLVWRREYEAVVNAAIAAVNWESLQLEDRRLVAVTGGPVHGNPTILKTFNLQSVECIAFTSASKKICGDIESALRRTSIEGLAGLLTDANEAPKLPLTISGFVSCGVFIKSSDSDSEEVVRNWSRIDAPVACTTDEEQILANADDGANILLWVVSRQFRRLKLSR